MVGWIFVIAVAILMFYTADTVVYVVVWLVTYLNAALSAVGIRIEVFDYLDILYPYFRSTVQAMAIGVIAIAVLHIVTAIRERWA
jgi:hypothetical protein